MGRPKKENTSFTPQLDTGMFSDEELKTLEAQALVEFEEDEKAASAAAFKEETKRKLREKKMFAAGKDAKGSDVQSVLIDLAPHSPYLNIDGRLFYNGVTYKMTTAQAASAKEAMHRTWLHEREIGGANINAMNGYTPLNRRISPTSQVHGAA